VAHQRESLTGAGVEADRRDSLLFHFISFFFSFFMLFVRTRRTDDAGVHGRAAGEKETERKGCYQGSTAMKGSAMRQGEIVQCQGYMGARA